MLAHRPNVKTVKTHHGSVGAGQAGSGCLSDPCWAGARSLAGLLAGNRRQEFDRTPGRRKEAGVCPTNTRPFDWSQLQHPLCTLGSLACVGVPGSSLHHITPTSYYFS